MFAARGLTERAVFIPALVVAWDQLVEHAVPVGLEVAGWVCLQHIHCTGDVFIPALVVAWDQLVEHAVPVGLEVANWVCFLPHFSIFCPYFSNGTPGTPGIP